ncbi:MFS transporter [Streptomyces sp. NPDC032472]|uniref:MFS transporter n=1 Tax=Streptomyces sp. NPDC032472 TaxID=3155018 RepID=UPI0033EFC0AB
MTTQAAPTQAGAAAGSATPLHRMIAGQGVSTLGSTVTEIAMPLAALQLLGVEGWQLGLLASLTAFPNLVLGIPAGAWIDRARPKQVMIVCDLVRLVLMAGVPLAAAFGALGFAQLCVVAAGVGCCTVLFDMAASSYLPRLVGIEHLIEARSKQSTVRQLADVIGQSGGGALTSLVGGARAMAVDAASYAVSLVCLWGLPAMPAADRSEQPESLVRRIGDGLRYTWKNGINRFIVAEAGHYNLFYRAFMVVFMVHAVRDLHWSGTTIGILMACMGVGAAVGATLAPRCARRLGVGRAIITALLVADLATLATPFVTTGAVWAAVLLGVVFFVMNLGAFVSGVIAGSLNRAVTPEHLYGRIVGANRVISRGGASLGGLLGGALLTLFDNRVASMICAVGMSAAIFWVARPSIARVRELPTHEPA